MHSVLDISVTMFYFISVKHFILTATASTTTGATYRKTTTTVTTDCTAMNNYMQVHPYIDETGEGF